MASRGTQSAIRCTFFFLYCRVRDVVRLLAWVALGSRCSHCYLYANLVETEQSSGMENTSVDIAWRAQNAQRIHHGVVERHGTWGKMASIDVSVTSDAPGCAPRPNGASTSLTNSSLHGAILFPSSYCQNGNLRGTCWIKSVIQIRT